MSDLFDRLCDIIDGQQVAEWQGGIHPEDVGHLARALIAAGVTLPEPVPPRCTGRIGHRRCILDTGHRGGHF